MAALHGDRQLQAIVETLIARHGVDGAVETGTFRGDTTAFLAQRVRTVATIEARKDFARQAAERLRTHRNARVIHGDGAAKLFTVVSNMIAMSPGPVLCFLDSHWQDAWPLKGELASLAEIRKRWPGRLLVVVDDLRVPNRPIFQGCDGGGGTVGHDTYGPKTFEGGHPADITGFPELREWPELWWPSYVPPEPVPGVAIVSDIGLHCGGLPLERDQG